MLRKREDSDVYEIDRELTWKWAVERNAELQEELLKLKGKHRRLEKQFKKLQVEHSRVLFDMDAVIEHEVDVKHKKAMEENRKLKFKIRRLMEDLEWNEKIFIESDNNFREWFHKAQELEEENEELKKELNKSKECWLFRQEENEKLKEELSKLKEKYGDIDL